MTASLSGVFSLQEFTDPGLPMVGGRLYTYTAGTTTQKVAYTDAAGTIPQAYTADGLGGQYIALNARGELPAPLFLTSGAYDITLKRPDGSTVWTRQASPISDVADSSLITFSQSGAGSVPRSLSAKLQESISTKDKGAVADGSTNDATAITNANAQAAAIGASLLFEGVHHIGTPITITVPIVDTLAQIFSLTSQVTIANGLPVRPEWWGIGNLGTIVKAIAALPAAGGVVQLEEARYKPNGFYYGTGATSGNFMTRDNITIQGRKMGQPSADCKTMSGGSIIEGMWLAYANDFTIRDVSIDDGYTVMNTYFGGVVTAGQSGEGMLLTFPDDTTKAAATLKRNAHVHNVNALCLNPTAAVHALILGEGYTGVRATGDIVGIYGLHGCAIKCSDVSVDRITTYLNSGEGVIFKTDSGATQVCTRVQVSQIVVEASGPTGTSPYVGAAGTGRAIAVQALGGSIDEIQIGIARTRGYPQGLGIDWQGSFVVSALEVGHLIHDGFGVAGTTMGVEIVGASSQSLLRTRFGSVAARNCTYGFQISVQAPADVDHHVSVGRLTGTNVTNVLDIGGQTYMTIDQVIADTASDAVYHIIGTPSLKVGMMSKDNATTTTYSTASGGIAPALANGWTQVAGGDAFGVDLLGGRVNLRGLIKPGTTNVPTTLPQWAWPATPKRFLAQAYNGTTQVAVPILLSTLGVLTVNEVAGGFANCSTWLSLSGITYDLQG